MSERTETTLEQPHAESAPWGRAPRRPRMVVVAYGTTGTRSAELEPGQSLVLGRAFPAQLVMDDPSLSRQHARITWRDDGSLELEDLDSRNGTFVRDERVERARLSPGERVTLGTVTAIVYESDPRIEGSRALASYDSLMARLREEVARARSLGRSVALLALRVVGEAAKLDTFPLARTMQIVQGKMRPFDRMAGYDSCSLLLLLPETDEAGAVALARSVVSESDPGSALRVGVAIYPASANNPDKLAALAQGALRSASAAEPVVVAASDESVSPPASFAPVLCSPRMRELFELVSRVAERAITVLVLGETGTGKEVVATAIHHHGPRSKGPLRTVNCAAIPHTLTESVLFGHERGSFTGASQLHRGVFEEASGGTLFLDEIGDLNESAQAALLRALETKRVRRVGGSRELEVDVRVVAATHRDLEQMVAEGKFRADLLYRLNTFVLHVPPLRERPEDVLPLAQHFLRSFAVDLRLEAPQLSPEAAACLEAYPFPGNVRELRNVIERALVVCRTGTITPEDLTEQVRGALRSSRLPPVSHAAVSAANTETLAPPALPSELVSQAGDSLPEAEELLRDKLRDYEVRLILEALERSGGSQVRAAELLGIPLRTLVHKIKHFGIRQAYQKRE